MRPIMRGFESAIEVAAIENTYFRKVLDSEHSQLTIRACVTCDISRLLHTLKLS
jgi:hypothetical protein